MANERYDIEVTDKVDDSIPTKLREIASAATAGDSAVKRLKANLASINESPVRKLAAASASMSNALARELNATAKLTTARSAAAVADARAATETQRLATELARTEAAQSRAAAAAARASAAQMAQEAAGLRLAATQARLAQSAGAAATGQDRLASEVDQARAAFDRGEINIRAYVAALQAANGAAGGAAAGLNNAANQAQNAANKYGQSAKGIRSHNANIIAQLQDIGVSLAGGQNPFLVMIQQGSQLSYIASTMDGGFKALTATILRMLAPFTLLAAIVGGLYLGFRNFTNDMATRNKPALEAYANTLGLTEKEMKKLQGTTVGANGQLKEHDHLVITMGDSWNGFIATVKEGLSGFSDEWGVLTDYLGKAWDAVTNFLYHAFIGFYGSVVGGMRAIVKIIVNLPSVAKNTAVAIANATATAVEWLINKTIDGINWLAQQANSITSHIGIEFGQLGQVSFGRFAQDGADAFDIIAEEATNAMREADRTLTGFSRRWEANTVAAAKKRIRGMADGIISERTPDAGKKQANPKTQVDYINDVNAALDNELSRMRMLKDEREVQQRLDQIEEEFLKRRTPLDQAQLDAFRAKIVAIQQYKYQQTEMDRINEEAVAPLRTLNAVIAASTDLLNRNVITQQQAAAQQILAQRAYEQATNPLFEMQEAMTQAEAAARGYGVAAQQAAFAEQVRQAFLAKGIDLTRNATAADLASAQALIARNNALLQQQYIQGQVSSIVDPLLQDQMMLDNKAAFYAEIERMRQADLLSEEQAQQARYALDARFNEMRLSGYSSFFGELASLQSSGMGELAAIGKAAAVAQATIDGYLAVQKALASAPPPLNYAMAAAVAIKTGAQVAGIVSTNVGSFATGGQFMVDGRAGVDANNINMNVTKGERVTIETPAQQRANDAGSGSPRVTVPVKVVNVRDPREALDAIDTAEGEQVIMNVMERNAPALRRLLG
ncbi:tail tape measure protein [Sphingomonas phage Birtae]|nr:tail tape measure protein [Sphingomonas phage Birtae]